MTSNIPGFFQGTEMPDAGWWEALWPNPAGVLSAVGVAPGNAGGGANDFAAQIDQHVLQYPRHHDLVLDHKDAATGAIHGFSTHRPSVQACRSRRIRPTDRM